MNIDELLIGALAGIPDLRKARCKGRTEWDEYDCMETVEYCIHRCNSCVELQKCREWYLALRPSQRPVGVCAGELRRPPRPRKQKESA